MSSKKQWSVPITRASIAPTLPTVKTAAGIRMLNRSGRKKFSANLESKKNKRSLRHGPGLPGLSRSLRQHEGEVAGCRLP